MTRARRSLPLTLGLLLVTCAVDASAASVSVLEDARERVGFLADAHGVPILPDLARARSLAQRRATLAANELTFTFDSPANPWTPAEVATLTAALADFYPVAKGIYGPPAFNITVNVRRDPSSPFVGEYNASSNEMVLASSADLTVLCHEMIHAFRDDYLIGLSSFEEGMTRAAEVEVFGQLAAYTHTFDERHSYTYDVFYDGLNQAIIGARRGEFFFGYPSPLLRYQLAGYAWGKGVIENPAFLASFNQAFYARMLVDPATRTDESALTEVAGSVQATIEGQPFASWYAAQGVLNTDPPLGYILYQRMNQNTIDYFWRIPEGNELAQSGATIEWSVFDHTGALLSSGSDLTNVLGVMSFSPTIPPGYTGRLEVLARTTSPEGPVSSRAWRPAGAPAGVFGVVLGADTGSVTITPLDAPALAVTTAVADGAFYAPALATVRGRFSIEFDGAPGVTATRQFTKDASDYYLQLPVAGCTGDAACPACEVCDAGTCVPRPAPACTVPTTSRAGTIDVQDAAADKRDHVTWQWKKGDEVTLSELGDPSASDAYALCVWNTSGKSPQLLLRLVAPGGGTCDDRPCWSRTGRAKSPTGWKYADPLAARDGLKTVQVKAGGAGKASARVSAGGMNLPLTPFSTWPVPLTVQLQGASGVCLQTTFSATGLRKNAAGHFQARSD